MAQDCGHQAGIVEKHGRGDDQQPPHAGGLHGRDGTARAVAEDRGGSRAWRTQRREHGIVARKRGAQFRDAAGIAAQHHQALARREFLRRPHEGGEAVSPLEALGDQLPPNAASGPQEEKPHWRWKIAHNCQDRGRPRRVTASQSGAAIVRRSSDGAGGICASLSGLLTRNTAVA